MGRMILILAFVFLFPFVRAEKDYKEYLAVPDWWNPSPIKLPSQMENFALKRIKTHLYLANDPLNVTITWPANVWPRELLEVVEKKIKVHEGTFTCRYDVVPGWHRCDLIVENRTSYYQ